VSTDTVTEVTPQEIIDGKGPRVQHFINIWTKIAVCGVRVPGDTPRRGTPKCEACRLIAARYGQ